MAVLTALSGTGAVPGHAQAPGTSASGQSQYEAKCGGCHSLDANRVGPRHRGVVGRRPGGLPDYEYSSALKMLGGVWTTERLDTWLRGPQQMAPGSTMFLSVPDKDQRRDIIAYLTAASPAPS